jgi:acyl-CoA thioester hydrolase
MTTAERAATIDERGFTEAVRVYHDDLDLMGMLHNARYAIVLERALSTFWDRHGYGFNNGVVVHPDAFVAVAEYTIKYRKPVRGTGEVAVHLWVDHIGPTSVVYGFRIHAADSATVHADGKRVQVRLDPKSYRPCEWAPETVKLYQSLMSSG